MFGISLWTRRAGSFAALAAFLTLTVSVPTQELARAGEDQERPILHLEVKKNGAQEYPVMVATTADGRTLKTFEKAHGAVWSPKGDRFVFIAVEDGLVHLRAMNLKGEHQTLWTAKPGQEGAAWQPAWSPDGRKIAVIVISPTKDRQMDYSLVVIDAVAGKELARHPLPRGPLSLPFHMSPPDKFRWSPDGAKLLISWESAVVVVTETGRTLKLSGDHVVAEWAPSGNAVYYFETYHHAWPPSQRNFRGFYLRKLDADSPVRLADEPTLAKFGIGRHPGIHFGKLSLSPGNDKLALVAGSSDGQRASIRLYDLKTGQALALDKPTRTYETEDRLVDFEWAPDASKVAVLTIGKESAVAIKVLDLKTGSWKVVAKVNMDLRRLGVAGLEFLGLAKNLSWTR